jgi:hypothetical protein
MLQVRKGGTSDPQGFRIRRPLGHGAQHAQITSNTYDVWGRSYQLSFNYEL